MPPSIPRTRCATSKNSPTIGPTITKTPTELLALLREFAVIENNDFKETR